MPLLTVWCDDVQTRCPEILKGDQVTISHGSKLFIIRVATARDWAFEEDDTSNWYIEGTHETPGLEGQPSYWKERVDKGTKLVKVTRIVEDDVSKYIYDKNVHG